MLRHGPWTRIPVRSHRTRRQETCISAECIKHWPNVDPRLVTMWYQWKPLGMDTLASTQVLLSTSFASLRLCKARATYKACLMMKMASSLRKRSPNVNSYLKPPYAQTQAAVSPYGSNERSSCLRSLLYVAYLLKVIEVVMGWHTCAHR